MPPGFSSFPLTNTLKNLVYCKGVLIIKRAVSNVFDLQYEKFYLSLHYIDNELFFLFFLFLIEVSQ